MLEAISKMFDSTFPASFINFSFLPKYASYFVDGVLNTLALSIVAVLLAVIPALLLALMRLSKNRFIHGLSGAYIAVFRSTPLMVQLAIIYFGIFYIIQVPRVYIGFIRLDMFIPFVVSLALNSSAYVAEIFRSGIMSIDNGQFEAGRSLGFNYVQTMVHIIMPQAFKVVLPTLCNEFISLLKETSVSGYIAIQDLTKGGDIIRSRTYSAFMPLIAVALVYLTIVLIFTKLIQILERRLRQNER